MEPEKFSLTMKDGARIACFKWLPDQAASPKTVVQIVHGLAEHSKRYGHFAAFLNRSGYAVYSSDHRGHGETAGAIENLGCFPDENGWRLVVEDLHALTERIRAEHPGAPVFLFGHSMGSLLSRHYIFLHGGNLRGAILSGTSGNPGLLGEIGIGVAVLVSKLKGKQHRSPLLTKLVFGPYNKSFKPKRTDFDWLSRDKTEVDKYMKDPYCGMVMTAGFFYELFKGVKALNKMENIKKIPVELPIFLFSGEKDPVGGDTKGVRETCRTYKQAGIKEVSLRFYKEGRHEMLNELNKEDVYQDVISWIDSHL